MQEVYELQNPFSYAPVKILSFGCSNGYEVQTLRDKYFKHSFITGCDINAEVLERAIKNHSGSNIKYISAKDLANGYVTYEIIFCLSVLSNAPEISQVEKPIEFSKFNEAVIFLYQKLDMGGYLVVFNSNYNVKLSSVGKYLMPIKQKDIKFSVKNVSRFAKDGNYANDDAICIYKKIA